MGKLTFTEDGLIMNSDLVTYGRNSGWVCITHEYRF